VRVFFSLGSGAAQAAVASRGPPAELTLTAEELEPFEELSSMGGKLALYIVVKTEHCWAVHSSCVCELIVIVCISRINIGARAIRGIEQHGR